MEKGWQGARELTVREREILQGIWSGLPNKEIASLYGISPRTVEHHRRNMMRKCRVSNTAALLRRAVAHGLLKLHDITPPEGTARRRYPLTSPAP